MKKIIKPLQLIYTAFLRVLMPHSCISCQELITEDSKTSICPKCYSDFKQINYVDRAEIERINEDIKAEKILAQWQYSGKLRDLIIAYKFSDKIEFKNSLSQLLPTPSELENAVLIPVPIHRRKLLTRKYNQATELAKIYARKHNLTLEAFALKRTKFTKQIGKSKTQRAEQLGQSIEAQLDLTNKNVYLIDDILTTGATLKACIKALKKAGANKIVCITLAFTPLQQTENASILSFNPEQEEG